MFPACWMLPPRLPGFGGKGIRTPDFQLAKLALYQLSYAPARGFGTQERAISIHEAKWQTVKCKTGDPGPTPCSF